MARHSEAMTHRRPTSPFVIDVARLGRRPGAMMTVREQRTATNRIGLDLESIPAGAAVDLDVQVQSVSEGVLVTGTVAGPTTGECSRCLSEISGDIEIDLTELFAYPDSATDTTSEDDELGRVVDDVVDLEQAICDAVGLALPLAPLCRPDCPGLCPDCGVALVEAGLDHHHDTIDPRWAKLSAVLDRSPGEERR